MRGEPPKLIHRQHIAGQAEHNLGSADQAIDSHRFVGPVGEGKHRIVVGMGAGETVGDDSQWPSEAGVGEPIADGRYPLDVVTAQCLGRHRLDTL